MGIRWPIRIKSNKDQVYHHRCRFIRQRFFITGEGDIVSLRPFLTIIPLHQGVKRKGRSAQFKNLDAYLD